MIIKKYYLILLMISACYSYAYDRVTGKDFASRSEVIATEGIAATSQPLATEVAIQILRQGGNAIDAAIAANAMLGLVEPTGSGIGGDLFAIIWDAKTQQLYGLNASGRSPSELSFLQLKQVLAQQNLSQLPPFGALPVSIPGAVDGWFELHERFGELPMASLLQPAIHYAEQGFPVSELIAYYLTMNTKRIGDYPGFKETFMPTGNTPKKGEIFKNPNLAKVYRILAKEGQKGFYKGEVAQIIANTVQQQGGFLSAEDLSAHRSEWVNPVSTNYRGYDVWELPPNGQGIAALQILNVMEQYNVTELGFGSADYIHTFVEAKKLAFADRAKFYADPAFNQLPIKGLISKSYALERKKLIKPIQAAKRLTAGNPALYEGDTIYLTTADKAGNMVSLIQSNYRGMGSGVIPKGLGFVLQNRGQLFSMEPGHFNQYAANKRPFHTIIPAFVTKDNQPWLSFGVMGGATQPQMHAQIIMNLIDFGMNLQEAGDAPRILHTGSSQPTGEQMLNGGFVSLEQGFDFQVQRKLLERGHKIQMSHGAYGGYQAIMRDKNGVYYAASESRKDGHAAGF